MESLVFPSQGEPRPTPALTRHLDRRIFSPALAIGEDLPLVAVTERPPPVSILHPPEGGTWIAATHDSDPVALARGGFYAPDKEIERLTALCRAGVDPDIILVGHELPGQWRPGDPVPAAYLPGESTTAAQILDAQAATLAAGLSAARGLLGVAGRVGVGLGAAAVGAVGAIAVGPVGAFALDPFVLAGVCDPKTDLVGWVLLGAWDEQPAE